MGSVLKSSLPPPWPTPGGKVLLIVGDDRVGLFASPLFLDLLKKVVVRAWGAFRPPGDFRPSLY